VGVIPVLLAWLRITGQWHSTGRRVIPKALCALSASICVVQAGFHICRALTDRTQGAFPVYLILFGFFALGLLLNLAALFLALRERNDARAAVLTGSIAVAVVNAAGFIWLFIATNGSQLSR
jgi:hypothetical protein